MIQGIQGFVEFTNTMVGEEITQMEISNNKLKAYLPSMEQKSIDMVAKCFFLVFFTFYAVNDDDGQSN